MQFSCFTSYNSYHVDHKIARVPCCHNSLMLDDKNKNTGRAHYIHPSGKQPEQGLSRRNYISTSIDKTLSDKRFFQIRVFPCNSSGVTPCLFTASIGLLVLRVAERRIIFVYGKRRYRRTWIAADSSYYLSSIVSSS